MGLECGWRHARKRWSWEYEDFEEESVEKLRLDHWGESWILTVERCSWVFQISNNRDLKYHKRRRALGWSQTFKNCVSLLMSPWDRKQKLINPKPVWNDRFGSYLYLYYYYWYHQIIQHNLQCRRGSMQWLNGVYYPNSCMDTATAWKKSPFNLSNW